MFERAFRFAAAVALAVVATLLFAVPSFAADVVAAAPTDDWLSPFVELGVGSTAAIVAGAVVWVLRKVGVASDAAVEARMKDTINGVAIAGIHLAMARFGFTAADLVNAVNKVKVLSFASDYLKRNAPDALAWFDKDHNGVLDIVEARLLPALAATPAVATAPK